MTVRMRVSGRGGGFSSCVWLSEQPIVPAPVRPASTSPRWHRHAPCAHEAPNCPRLSVQTAAGKHSAATNHAAADTNVLGAPRVPRLTSEHRTAPASTADGQTRCAESGPPRCTCSHKWHTRLAGLPDSLLDLRHTQLASGTQLCCSTCFFKQHTCPAGLPDDPVGLGARRTCFRRLFRPPRGSFIG